MAFYRAVRIEIVNLGAGQVLPKILIGGIWRPCVEAHILINGVWRKIVQVFIHIDGAWKDIIS